MNASIFRGRPAGEVAVIGLGKSGRAAAELLRRDGHSVYISDAGRSELALANAAALGAIGVAVDVGYHDLDRIARAALVVASPGVPPDAPPIVAARRGAGPVVGEIEIALHYMPDVRYVAVTGTNGKTTTTALVGHLLRALGHDAVDAGNIGLPLAEVALRQRKPDWIALELSSFQLHDTPSVDPTVGVLTNLTPDHLDRYASVEEYFGDKRRLFANAHSASKWVVNADDPRVVAMAAGVRGERFTFAVADRPDEALADAVLTHPTGTPPAAGGDARAELAGYTRPAVAELRVLGEPLLPRDELPLLGDHNVANALAAALAVTVADDAHATPEARATIAAALRTFRALEHRMEVVGERDGVQWINDSKATNVSSTLVAVQGMTRPYVLLLGGRHKGEPYTALAEPFARHGRVVLAYGESAELVERDLGSLVTVERVDGTFADVMARARALARPGDAVLLSPACSSYDMFDNYEHRGAEFRRLAMDEA